MLGKEYRTQILHCPWCDAEMDAATSIDPGSRAPQPGDFTVCFHCAQITRFDADLQMAKVTDADVREHLDAETYAHLMLVRRAMLEVDRSRLPRKVSR